MSLQLLQAQLHDKNWVFGKNNLVTFYEDSIGIKYLDVNDTSNYYYLGENVTCISDISGNLLLHNNEINAFSTDTAKQIIINNNKEINYQESSFIASSSTTNGSVILPIYPNSYIYVYLQSTDLNENFKEYKLVLKYHLIEFNNNEWQYKKYAQNLFSNFFLSERLKAIKHPNGKDWWIIIQESLDNSCSEKIISLLLSKDSLTEINTYIGVKRCNHLSLIGEIAITKSGDKIAMAYANDSVEVFDFDRCTGMFSNSRLYLLDNPNLQSYGLEFSPNGQFLYVNSFYQSPLNNGKLQQIKLSDGTVRDVISFTTLAFQIERGPDDKLYFGYGGDFYKDSIYYPNARGYLHCIENPDSVGLACNVNLGKIKLNNDAWLAGLPNFPNFRLGALSIYEAHAGRDTVLCIDSTVNQKVVELGSPTINGVQYQWYPNYNLSSDTAAQPLAFPDSSTWYYVTLTDTTIQDACQSRTDSVWVEVKQCLVLK
jgi:hypothetical protein